MEFFPDEDQPGQHISAKIESIWSIKTIFQHDSFLYPRRKHWKLLLNKRISEKASKDLINPVLFKLLHFHFSRLKKNPTSD